MDVITAEKLFATKYCYRKSQLFLFNLSLHSVIVFFFSFLLSSQSHRFPPDTLSSMIRMVVTPPSFFSPRCLFVVVNVIIVYIVGERKLTGAKSSSVNGMYEEYCVEKTEEMSVSRDEDMRELVEKVAEEEEEEEEEEVGAVNDDGAADGGEKEKEREEEDDGGLANEELNKRAEAFIARVNKQRRLEAVNCFQW